ncbi:MAG TPA: isoaspartyl peptidase/L-asparaginase family protein [Candidatus Dormibacteraeota bacterium]|nr:isoaspartyl peptidase/L-asparaginase family protein [Candidatus Dormibacteraeota bacterium]
MPVRVARPALIVHGGAGPVPPAELPERQAAVERALEAGWRRIGDGAVEAAVAAVRHLEDEPLLNAGIGACLNADGVVELDAGVMDGRDRSAGGVACLRDVRHPIDLALAVMRDGRHVLLAADGASRFAREHGLEMCDPSIFITDRKRQELAQGADTVGAVARDADGHLGVAVSTGGRTGKLPGRIGDSPIAGAGFYADDRHGAIVGTGVGEAFIRLGLSRVAIVELEHGMDPAAVAKGAIEWLGRSMDAGGGVILIGREGEPQAAFNTPAMPWAMKIE